MSVYKHPPPEKVFQACFSPGKQEQLLLTESQPKSAFCSQAGEALCHGSATCLSTPPHSGVEYVALIPVSSVPQHHSTPPPPPPSNLHRAFNLDKQVLEMEASWVLLAKTHALLCLCYFWKTGLTQKSGVNEGGWPVYCSFSSLFFS